LDSNYGSTYRSRHIAKALNELNLECVYVESNLRNFGFPYLSNVISIYQPNNLVGYFGATVKRAIVAVRQNYDILFVQKLTPLTVPCIIVAKLRGKKCIVDWDDLDWALQKNIFKKIIVFLCEHFFCYVPDLVTTHSRRLKRYANRLGVKRIEIVNQIVDFDKREITEEEKDRLKESIGAKEKTIICFLGTLTAGGARGLDVIIKAVGRLARKRNDFFFLILGGGPLERKIKNLINRFDITNNTYITGIISHEEVPKYLSIVDIGLVYMPDNIGDRMRVSLKVLEYLSLGIPIIGRIIGETKDIFSKFCVAVDSYEDFVLKIDHLLNSQAIEKDNFSRVVSESYSLTALRNSLKQILTMILA